MAHKMSWAGQSFGHPLLEMFASGRHSQPLSLNNRDYLIVPVGDGGTIPLQAWGQPQLQKFDSENLKNIKEYEYKELPRNKKRIRLVELDGGASIESPDIFCTFHEADFDDIFHVPMEPMTNDAAQEHRGKIPKLPPYYEPNVDEHSQEIQDKRKEHKDSKKEMISQRRRERAHKQEAGKDEKDSEAKAELGRHWARISGRRITYEALSWCWGNDEPEYAIKIRQDGKTFKIKVRKELALALKFLRRDESRMLWIDAICIDQKNPNERNHQVQMMSRIYTRAENVCIWLGEDNRDSKMAIDFIRDEIMELKDFDTLCTDTRHTHKWQALMMLMQAPWFSRRWVVQEIALARNAVVYCGRDSIPWRDFAVAVELFVEVETATHRLSEIMQKDEKFRHVPGWFEYVSELGASLLVQATGKVFRNRQTPTDDSKDDDKEGDAEASKRLNKFHTIDPLERRSLLSLEYLVTTLFIFKATEPRDVIYSLLAIARDAAPFAETSSDDNDPAFLTTTLFNQFLEEKPFHVDYNRPYSDVCRDFVRFTTLRKSKVDAIQALDILCRPWALEPPDNTRSNRVTHKKDDGDDESYGDKIRFPSRTKPWYKRLDRTFEQVEGKWRIVKKTEVTLTPDQRSMSEYIKDIKRKQWDDGWTVPKWPLDLSWEDDYESWCNSEKEKREKEKQERMKRKKNGHQNNQQDTLGEARTKAGKSEELKLPSWVARASRAPISLDYHPGMRFLKTGRANADPLVGHPSDGHRNYSAAQTRHVNLEVLKFKKRPGLTDPLVPHYSMYVQGFELDEVEQVTDASQGGDIPASWLEMGNWKKTAGEYSSDPPDELWRTLVADRGRDNRNPPYYYARACRESVHKGSISSGRVDTTALINNERNSIVAEFCRRVHAVIWNRRLFRTKGKRLGLAHEVEVGDKICILYGCTVPVVLKQKTKEIQHLKLEKFEDDKEALKACIRQWEKNCESKHKNMKRNLKKKAEWLHSGEWYEMMEAKKIAEARLAKDAKRAEEDKSQDVNQDSSEWNEDGDNDTSAPGLRRSKTDFRQKAEKAKEDDPLRYYIFQGDCYLHGMMDGEAMREKFYEGFPDRLFELR